MSTSDTILEIAKALLFSTDPLASMQSARLTKCATKVRQMERTMEEIARDTLEQEQIDAGGPH